MNATKMVKRAMKTREMKRLASAMRGMPWARGFERDHAARNFFFGLTAMTFAVIALAGWNARS
jgi:hypothetical protein